MKITQAKTRGGFTLVEVLVVITIIAVVLALSLGGYTKYRSAADKAVTTGILREMQIANGNYAADNNGYFVSVSSSVEGQRGTFWYRNREFLDQLRGFSDPDDTSSIARNFPAEKLDKRAQSLKSPGWDHVRGNYGAFEKDPTNASWGSSDYDSSFSIAQLTSPGRTASFATALDWRIKNGTSYNGQETGNGQGKMAYRHDGKAIVAFYDGHVESITKADMEKIMDNGGKDHPFWKGNY